MYLQKKPPGHETGDEAVAVMVRPLPGHSDQEVVDLLTSHGARHVTVLAPGFVSAEARRSALGVVEAIAHVQPKARKRPC